MDSIAPMSQVIAALRALDAEAYSPTAGSPCGKTVFHTSTISGGTDYATYPTQTTLGIEIGTQPGEHLADRVTEIEKIFADLAAADGTFRGDLVFKLGREPSTPAGHEALLAALNGAFEQARGRAPAEAGLNAWTDAAL